MFRGTTPTFRFVFKDDITKVTKAVATFACNREVIVRKNLDDMFVDENRLVLKLSQEETFRFPANSTVEIQIAVEMSPANGESTPLVGRSRIFKIPSERILEENPL